MYNPCFECMRKYGREYTKKCDNTCDYAAAVKFIEEVLTKNKILQDKIIDLENELECYNDY